MWIYIEQAFYFIYLLVGFHFVTYDNNNGSMLGWDDMFAATTNGWDGMGWAFGIFSNQASSGSRLSYAMLLLL